MKQVSRTVKATDEVPLNIVTVKHNESLFRLADAGTWPAFIQLLLYPKPLGREQFFPLRVLLLIAMFFFTIQLMLNGYDAWIAQYLHCLNLPVHEFGHIVFAIFGNEVIHSLGGSLFQIIMPIVFCVSLWLWQCQAVFLRCLRAGRGH